jgi:tRNA(Ile)-lysidine synthase
MALAAATAFVAARSGWQPYAVVIDHQLQPGSATVATGASDQLSALGFASIIVREVVVDGAGGPEAAARSARYSAIDEVADEIDASVILLGHTRDDQAESVLLGLARGSGGRSIQGMSPRRGRYVRPLLGIDRATTRTACADLSIEVWDDPHNDDPGFTRVKVRRDVMPMLEAQLGPGIAAALARTAELLQADDVALEAWAADVRRKAQVAIDGAIGLDVDVLMQVPVAVRLRVVRAALIDAGVPAGDLRASHLADIDALVGQWKGQGEVHLPGKFAVARSSGRLLISQRAEYRPHW